MGTTYDSPCSRLHELFGEVEFEARSATLWGHWAWGSKWWDSSSNHSLLDHDLQYFFYFPFISPFFRAKNYFITVCFNHTNYIQVYNFITSNVILKCPWLKPNWNFNRLSYQTPCSQFHLLTPHPKPHASSASWKDNLITMHHTHCNNNLIWWCAGTVISTAHMLFNKQNNPMRYVLF